MNPPADQSPKGGDPQGLHAKHASGGDAKRQAQNTGTVDLEKRLEALLAEVADGSLESRQMAYLILKLEMIDALPLLLTQLREYRTALEPFARVCHALDYWVPEVMPEFAYPVAGTDTGRAREDCPAAIGRLTEADFRGALKAIGAA